MEPCAVLTYNSGRVLQNPNSLKQPGKQVCRVRPDPLKKKPHPAFFEESLTTIKSRHYFGRQKSEVGRRKNRKKVAQ